VIIAGYPAASLLTARTRFCSSSEHNNTGMDPALKTGDEIRELLDLKFSTRRMGRIKELAQEATLAHVKDELLRGTRAAVFPPWK